MQCKKCSSYNVGATTRKDGSRTDYLCECGYQGKPFIENEPAPAEEANGKTERQLKMEPTEQGYKIYYGNTYVVATHEEIRQSLMMYCVGKQTINKVASAMKWTRAEFHAVKTAFNITKTDMPFTPYEIDNLTAEEMSEIVRIEKKRYAHMLFENSKQRDVEREIKRHNKVDYFTNQICKRVNALKFPPFTPVCSLPVEGRNTTIIKITDEHAGLEVDSIYNTYNLDVMRQRFNAVTNHIIQNVSKENFLVIESGGDLVHGKIHGSTEKASTYVMDALEAVIECYAKMFKALLDVGIGFSFTKANGSHSSLESNKMNRTEEENLGRILPFVLRQMFFDCDDFSYIVPVLGTNHTIVKIGGDKAILTGHGDEMQMKGFAAYANELSVICGLTISEVHLGHIHHEKMEIIDGVRVEHSLSFCGSDQYATRIGLTGDCGFTEIIYDGEGNRIGGKVIRF